MSLDFEFASRSRLTSRGFQLFAGAVLLLAVTITLSTLTSVKTRGLDDSIATTKAALLRRQPAPIVHAMVDLETQKRIRRTSSELTVSWDNMLDAFEATRIDAVTLMGVEAEATGASIRITGTGNTYADIITFVERLANRPAFYDVLLASHRAITTAPGSQVQFVITARWRLK